MIIRPLSTPTKPGFRVKFRHPESGKCITRGLGTRDLGEAFSICSDLNSLVSSRELWDARHPALPAMHLKALDIFFGPKVAAKIAQSKDALIVDGKPHVRTASLSAAGAILGGVGLSATADLLKENMTLKQRVADLESNLDSEVARREAAEYELAKIRRLDNKTVLTKLEQAAPEYLNEYRKTHARGSWNIPTKALDELSEFLERGAKTKIKDIDSVTLDRWLRSLDNDQPLNPTTKKRKLGALKTFFEWCRSEYGLFENPADGCRTIPGLKTNPQNIKAIRSEEKIRSMIDALSPAAYWQAVFALSVLAGPRYSELIWIKREDVYLADGYFRITSREHDGVLSGTKTGKERSVMIEKSILAPVLKEYLKTHSGRFNWLFPSVASKGTTPREKAIPGQWSENSVFRNHWRRIATKYGDGSIEWTYGPAEWRHTFGTALGMCGWSLFEISRAMGNSEKVANHYYVGKSGAPERRWKFSW